MTNYSNYGLTVTVYTQHQPKANRAVMAIDVGMVRFNNYNRNALGTPFGIYKRSGFVQGS